MTNLVLLSGLPRSGKTTLSKQYKEMGYEVISLDEERMSYYGDDYNEDLEPNVWDETRDKLTKLIKSGKNVLLDECNTNVLNLYYWIKNLDVEVNIKVILVDASPIECIGRSGTDEVLHKVILRKDQNKSTRDQLEEFCDRIGADFEVIHGD